MCVYIFEVIRSYLFIAGLEYKCGGDLFDLLKEYAFLTEDLVKLYVAEIAVAIGKIIFCSIPMFYAIICFSFIHSRFE